MIFAGLSQNVSEHTVKTLPSHVEKELQKYENESRILIKKIYIMKQYIEELKQRLKDAHVSEEEVSQNYQELQTQIDQLIQ